MKDNKAKAVAVKVEGPFTEWYSPSYEEPYTHNEEYAAYYDEVVSEEIPVVGPSLGESEDDYITGDLDCLSDRMASGEKNWQLAKEALEFAVENALDRNETTTLELDEGGMVTITPYTKENLPPVNEESLKVYGPFAEVMRAAVEAIG